MDSFLAPDLVGEIVLGLVNLDKEGAQLLLASSVRFRLISANHANPHK